MMEQPRPPWPDAPREASPRNGRLLEWIRYLILSLACILFLIMGIQILVAAYELSDPFQFVMTFFASNLMILLSLAFLAGLAFRMDGLRRSAGHRDSTLLREK